MKNVTIILMFLSIALIGCLDSGGSSGSSSSASSDSSTSESTSSSSETYPYTWSSTTHVEGSQGNYACYISFWEALGYMEEYPGAGYQLLDVHGSGAQRSDPKDGDPADYPNGFGPQGDVIVIFNYARCVRSVGGATNYPVIDTGQTLCYNNAYIITAPSLGGNFYGQDAQYNGTAPSYKDNGDGTITDNNTGLMWQKTPGSKMTWDQAVANTSSVNVGGYNDWRLPTIKELYSLMDFSGYTGMTAVTSKPYLDTNYFDFSYGDESAGERFIDAQYWSNTAYGSTTMFGNPTAFGVNFADGRIKGYPKTKLNYVMYVRGNTTYGENNFIDNGDGTITDLATGLMWMKSDSGILKAGSKGDGTFNWQDALSWAENLDYAGYNDWRLPNIKELQSIVDYTRSPDTTGTPCIDPIFEVSTKK